VIVSVPQQHHEVLVLRRERLAEVTNWRPMGRLRVLSDGELLSLFILIRRFARLLSDALR
jgi:hypothetical protein